MIMVHAGQLLYATCARAIRVNAGNARGETVNLLTAAAILLFGMAVQLTLETSAELTAETFADNDIGIARAMPAIASGDIIDISPTGMMPLRN